jgi:hypothetical protein
MSLAALAMHCVLGSDFLNQRTTIFKTYRFALSYLQEAKLHVGLRREVKLGQVGPLGQQALSFSHFTNTKHDICHRSRQGTKLII